MPRHPKDKPIDWKAIDKALASTDASQSDIAKRYGINPGTLSRYITSKGIVRKPRAEIQADKRERVNAAVAQSKPATVEPSVDLVAVEAEADVAFLNRAAKAATKALDNCEALLEVAGNALRGPDGKVHPDIRTVDAFEAGKANKIATETLGIARATYAKARHIEDDAKVNVNLTGDQIVSGLGGVIDEVVRMATKKVQIVAGSVTVATLERGDTEEVIDVEAEESGEA